jgi:Domain of unknown function (DUF1788)
VARIDEIADQYERHISAPWQRNLPGAQRIVFVVYPKEDERKLEAKLKDFENRTIAAGHPWLDVDFTNAFPDWMAGESYPEEYFAAPDLLDDKMNADTPYGFTAYCVARLRSTLITDAAAAESVVAVHGVGALFGFATLHAVLGKIQPDIRGRVVVFFPGSYEHNVYRMLDARDGWNYLATPIAC